jgi:uncharacterized protein YgiB involved in biofilm formation
MNRLKRTRRLALTTLMATASVNLVACGQPAPDALTWETSAPAEAAEAGEPVEAVAYTDPFVCRARDEVPDEECDAAWRQAQADHEAAAPRYGDKAACEAEYGEGACETRQSAGGGSFFMPFLAGMVLGRMTGGGGYYRGTGYYRDGRGQFSTPYGGRGSLGRDPLTGRLQLPRTAVEPTPAMRQARADARYQTPSQARTERSNRAVSRGGFRSTRSYTGRSYGG